jgi:hypothetical protein
MSSSKNQDNGVYTSIQYDNMTFIDSTSSDTPDSHCVSMLPTPDISPPRTAVNGNRGSQLPDSR